MPDSESNDNSNKRPKRHAAQRANAYLYHEQASVLCWSEEKELKKALLASLQDVKRTNNTVRNHTHNRNRNHSHSHNHNHSHNIAYSNSNCDQTTNDKTVIEYSCANENIDSSSICSKVASSSDGKESATIDDNNFCLLSLARKARIPAQRKFAQGSNNNSPISTPFKVGVVPTAPMVELFPNQRPKTEDFLTFLCLRRSPLLPPSLDFIGMNKKKTIDANANSINEENANSDTDMSLIDDSEQTDNNVTDKYSLCRINSTDRRGSASSTVSKATSLSSKTSVNPFNTRKSDIMKVNDSDISDHTKCLSKPLKRMQANCCDNTNIKKQRELRPSTSSISLSSQTMSKSHSKRSALKPLPSSKETMTSSTSYNILKEKYKQQRIDKKTSNPSNHIKCKRSNDCESKQLEGIQTRQRLRNYNYSYNNQIEEKIVNTKTMKSSANISQRVLRSHHSSICTHSLSSLSTALLLHRVNRKSKQFNTSHVGVRPQKRKAKPVVPLIDYHFFSDSESDTSDKKTKTNRKKILESQHKTKYAKSSLEDNKFKNKVMLRKTYSFRSPSPRPPGRPKANVSSLGKNKTKTSPQPRRLTRSSKRISPPKDAEALEKERLIKQQIIEIEKKHKRLRRFPSDVSLHSSSTTSSSSSESLPNSSSSSSSINIPRLTRSLEHLKRIRDIAAKLKKEQKVEKKKTKVEESLNKHKRKRKHVLKSVNKEKSTEKLLKSIDKKEKQIKEKTMSTDRIMSESMTNSDTDCQHDSVDSIINNDCEDSIASANSDIDEDIESASKGFLQDMAEEINTLDDMTTEGDQPLPELVYCNTDHIQGLMTTEFSGAFSEETVTTASAILLPSGSASYHYIHSRNTVDASTNTTEDDLLECLAVKTDYKLSVGTQTITPANSPQVADSNK